MFAYNLYLYILLFIFFLLYKDIIWNLTAPDWTLIRMIALLMNLYDCIVDDYIFCSVKCCTSLDEN